MAHPYKSQARQSGGSVDVNRLRRLGEFKLKLRTSDWNDYLPTDYRINDQAEKNRRETIDISRRFRKPDDAKEGD